MASGGWWLSALLAASGPVVSDVAAHVADGGGVHWVKAAELLLEGEVSCVDGRDRHGVIGTPGGDVGEILLGLAADEAVRGATHDAASIDALLAAWVDAFGRIYLHTDRHALDHLREAMRRDPALAPYATPDDDALLVTLRRPPAASRAALLDLLTEPAHIGCGHLRLATEDPAAYGLRDGLAERTLAAVFRALWAGAPIDLVVLDGEHEERAVVEVRLAHDVHAHTRVPVIVPRVGDDEVFVVHPQVAAWVREENVSFLAEHHAAYAGHPERVEALRRAVAALGDRHADVTLRRLASGLPRLVVDVVGADLTVRDGQPAAPQRQD